jgi:CRISPR/Cas system-associated exonuclease Cas4 (RecB family)
MIASLLRDRDELVGHTPHVSHSRINRYLTCPEQYRLYYIENLRPKVPPATLVFGSIMHQALAELIGKKHDPVKHFVDSWGMVKDIPLGYSQRDSWDKLKVSGERLLTKFAAEELPKIGDVKAVERPFTLSVTSLDLPFVGVIDLVAQVEGLSANDVKAGKNTVVDFKTAGSAPDEYEADMSDQLTAYKLAEPEAEQSALCVLVKTKEPQILWYPTERNGAQLGEYLAKVGYVAHEITAGRFYKRPGMWCAWCDFLPVCLGDKRRAEDTLVTVA